MTRIEIQQERLPAGFVFSRNLMLLCHTQGKSPLWFFFLAGKRGPPDVVARGVAVDQMTRR
jgi:hypothetical protein